MFSLLRPSEARVERYLRSCSERPFNYPHVGATAGALPEGYAIDRHRQLLGAGRGAFDRARRAVRLFKMNDFGWVEAHRPRGVPPGEEPAEGQIFATLARVMGIWTLNPCRIIYLVAEDDDEGERYGFAFGTVESHAEEGEERFLVERKRADDSVWYDILAFSRPHHLLARLGSPLSKRVQRRFFRDSKESMRRFVSADEP